MSFWTHLPMERAFGLVAIHKMTHGCGQILQSLTMMVLTVLAMVYACTKATVIMAMDGQAILAQVVPINMLIFVN